MVSLPEFVSEAVPGIGQQVVRPVTWGLDCLCASGWFCSVRGLGAWSHSLSPRSCPCLWRDASCRLGLGVPEVPIPPEDLVSVWLCSAVWLFFPPCCLSRVFEGVPVLAVASDRPLEEAHLHLERHLSKHRNARRPHQELI